jgi:hypothetical protein
MHRDAALLPQERQSTYRIPPIPPKPRLVVLLPDRLQSSATFSSNLRLAVSSLFWSNFCVLQPASF